MSRIYRWRDNGNWQDIAKRKTFIEKVEKAPEGTVVAHADIPDDEAAVGAVLRRLGVDWDMTSEMTEKDVHTALTAIVKKLLKGLLSDLIAGKVHYTDPYQAHQLVELLLKERRLSHGEPTEIRGHRIDVALLPEDDTEALSEGIRRLKMIADRRKALVEDNVIEGEVVDDGTDD